MQPPMIKMHPYQTLFNHLSKYPQTASNSPQRMSLGGARHRVVAAQTLLHELTTRHDEARAATLTSTTTLRYSFQFVTIHSFEHYNY